MTSSRSLRSGLLLTAVTLTLGCEPSGGGAVLVDGRSCAEGSIPADFTGLTPGAPFDHAFVVDVDAADVAFAADADPAISLRREPFAGEGGLVIPLRIQMTSAEPVSGTLTITPAEQPACSLLITGAP